MIVQLARSAPRNRSAARRRLPVIVAAFALCALGLAGLAGAAAGDLDPTFGTGGKVVTDVGSSSLDEAHAVAIQLNGKIVAAGISGAPGSADFALVRYLAGGTLDATFGNAGKALTDFGGDDQGNAVAIELSGRTIVAGFSTAGGSDDFALARYKDGVLDPTFGTGGKVLTDFGGLTQDRANAVAIQPNGKILVAGLSGPGFPVLDFALVRYNADGTLDASFGSGGKVVTDIGSSSFDEARAVAIQTNGRIVAAGLSTSGGTADFALVRYRADGSLDSTFGSAGKVLTDFAGDFDEAHGVALQRNGKIVAAGVRGPVASSDFALARYASDGSLDASFGLGGKVLTDFGGRDQANGVAIQASGRTVAAGWSSGSGSFDFALARYKDGILDPSFGSGGKVLTDFASSSFDLALALALQPNGKLVVAGLSASRASFDFALARYAGE